MGRFSAWNTLSPKENIQGLSEMPPASSVNKESQGNSDHGIKNSAVDGTKPERGTRADPKAKVYVHPEKHSKSQQAAVAYGSSSLVQYR